MKPFKTHCAVLCLGAQLFLTLCDPWTVAHQAPLSMGMLQARILDWVAKPSSRRSPQLRDPNQVSHIAGILYHLSHKGSPGILEWIGQEGTARTGHGTVDWFQIGKGVHQGCILSPCLFTYMQSTS